MPSIQELLENLGVEDSMQEKTASAENCSETEVKQAVEALGMTSNVSPTIKTASQETGGTHMNLQDLYDDYFGENTEKIASVFEEEDLEKSAAAQLEDAGEKAGLTFSTNLEDRLFKFAMDQAMESAATEERDGSVATMVAGATPASPQLPQNKTQEWADGKKMDTTPQHYNLLDKAIAKATILKALETNDTESVEGVSNVDTGLEMPVSQKNA